MTDEELVRDAIAGDQDAYTALFKRLTPRVKITGWKFFKDSARADEFVQDALSHVLMRLHKFDGTAKFSTWATRVIINYALGLKRGAKTKDDKTFSYDDSVDGEEGGVSFASSIADPRDNYARIEAREDVKKILERMNPYSRKLVVANLMYGHSIEDIARSEGLSHTAAKSQIYRAKMEARSIMETMDSVAGMSLDSHEGFDVSPVRDRVVDEKRSMTFEPKVCICGCGQTFIPNGPRQIFVMGHRIGAKSEKRPGMKLDGTSRKPWTRKDGVVPMPVAARAAPAKAELAVPVAERDVEMVNLRIPAVSLDRILQMLPTALKAEAVTQILTNLVVILMLAGGMAAWGQYPKTSLSTPSTIGFWHFNESSNEIEFWMVAHGGIAPHTCGFVGRAARQPGMYVADALGSGGATETTSMVFNTMDRAQRFVESKCTGAR